MRTMKSEKPMSATIMVVDDTPANLHLLGDMLYSQGWRVQLFPKACLALKAAHQQAPDLILLDIMMPEMDGFALCKELKADARLSKIPVIFISALTDTESKIRAFTAGGMDYVTKPFQIDEVLARIKTHLQLHYMQREQENHQQNLERLVRERTADLLRAQRVAHIGSWRLDIQPTALYWSPETYRLFGIPDGTPLILDDFIQRVHPEDRERVLTAWNRALEGASYDIEHRIATEGTTVWVRERAEFEFDAQGKATIAFGTVQDITTEKNHQKQIEFITSHDPLTGLPNRAMFLELLRPIMAAAVTHSTQLAVTYIDLDGFADLNSQHGRELGNRIVVEIGKRIVQAVREPHHVARIGGDEFAIILGHLRPDGAYTIPIQRLLQTIAEPLEIAPHTFHLTASIGIALYPQSTRIEAEQLLRQADQAMYLAKLAGKNRFHLFDPLKDESTRERFLRLDEIRTALQENQLVLFYQPKVHLQHGEIVGFEALIRWQHPERGLLPPSQFIPLLEQHPLSIPVGDWVIETALAQLAAWNAQGLVTSISVNIDGQQLQDVHFEHRLLRQLAQQPTVRPEQLELEILETGALDNMAHVSGLITRLDALGIRCALDDFGTGYSSLTFLKQLTASTIKIDQSFVRGMQDDAEHVAIVNSVLGLSRSFERTTLAEGIETEALGGLLIELGCELGQGYAIARPMPAHAVPDWIASWQPPLLWSQTHELPPQDIPTLLAEVEHRAWLKALRRYTEKQEPIEERPINDAQRCRFGRWINKTSTHHRLGHLAGFQELHDSHHALHQQAEYLLNRRPVTAASAWEGIETQSERILALLRELRQNPLNTNSRFDND
jgi:diguanylate cyclase (GGDEF)-like protein/PAS domain S-box-containing protein